MNARLQLLLGTLAVAISLPWAGPLSADALEEQIGSHVGSSTRQVACVRKNHVGDGVRYACALHGRDASPLRVRVDVDGGDWRAYWPPAQG